MLFLKTLFFFSMAPQTQTCEVDENDKILHINNKQNRQKMKEGEEEMNTN